MSGLTFEEFYAQAPGLAGHFRAARFDLLPVEDHESCWDHLAAKCERAIREELGDSEPPREPVRPAHGFDWRALHDLAKALHEFSEAA